jgi:hypothetical protein
LAGRARKKRRRSGSRQRSSGNVEGSPRASAAEEPGGEDATSDVSRSEAKNAAARAALEPLAEGERPPAVTVAAVVAFVLGAGNLIAFAAGLEVNGARPVFVLVVGQSAILLVAAVGMWRARYWAVLGMQALLALLILSFALFLIIAAGSAFQILASVAVLVAAGTLFWFLVKAMARIQMPERR